MSKINKIKQKTLLYLNHIANLVDDFPAPINNILKTSYMAQCDFIETTCNISKTEDYLTIICPTCNINISETARFQLISKKSSNFTKTLKKRLENGSHLLTNYQKRYAKRFPLISDDGQVAFNVTCNVCNKSIKKVISKWKRLYDTKKRPAPEEVDAAQQFVQNPPKKKKKQVDRTCGLNVEAIQSVQNRNIPQMGKPNKNGKKKTIALPKEPPKHRPVIINNINNNKKKRMNEANREIWKNKQKLGQIFGISLTHNSPKSIPLNNFFDSF